LTLACHYDSKYFPNTDKEFLGKKIYLNLWKIFKKFNF
jgi:hypothetical protein